MREIVLDTETTGLKPENGDRIIEIGCVELVNRVKTDNFFHCYLNPEREVSEEALKVHGISTDFLRDKPLFKDIAKSFLDFIADSKLIIHNAPFDIKFLNSELSLLGFPNISNDIVIDTLLIARRKFPGSSASLDSLCKRFNVDISKRDKHGALVDSELLVKVYLELTGGVQNSLFTSNNKSLKESNSDKFMKTEKIIRPARNFFVSEEEKEMHKDFILSKIKNSMWTSYS